MRLRSVELEMPRAGAAVEFLEGIWGLVDAGKTKNTSYLRGTGDHPYVVAITETASPAVSSVTFSGTRQEIGRIRSRAAKAGIPIEACAAELDEPGAPAGFRMTGPEGQRFRFVTDTKLALRLKDPDKPIALTHVPINTADADACTKFALEVLGFKLSDRTKIMDFIRCDSTHHSLAYVRSGVSALHHMAFEMQDLDAVMRGVGCLRDAGIEPAWGPGTTSSRITSHRSARCSITPRRSSVSTTATRSAARKTGSGRRAESIIGACSGVTMRSFTRPSGISASGRNRQAAPVVVEAVLPCAYDLTASTRW